MSDNKETARLKLRKKLDRIMHAFLNSKSWSRYWNFCQKHNINYHFYFSIGKLYKRIAKLFSEKFKSRLGEFDLYFIGQSHLDLAWLWTKLSTIRRALITAQQAVDHFKKYPYFTFSQTQAQFYDWVKRLRPELWNDIKKYEKEGRWEIVGGMWVEPDCNIPSGESLVRQRLYAQLFFLENFGKMAKIECLEDSFGFNAQLPQILIKSGAEAFWTTKITWNEYSEFPFANFIWRGIDGSEIFTHMYLFNWLVLFNMKLYKRTGRKIKEKGLVFDSTFTPEQIEEYMSEERIRTCGIFYGFGDGGMGPLKEEIDLLTNIARIRTLNINSLSDKFITTEHYFETLREECGDTLPIWNDELYLELHRGCYTSINNIKKLNRQCEVNLRNCEAILTLFTLFFKNFEYPELKIKKMWKDLLFNQFHDILPGSSIQDVYYEQEKELENVVKKTDLYLSLAMQFMLLSYIKRKDLMDDIDNYAIVINTLPWKRNGIIPLKSGKRESLMINEMPPISFRVVNIKELIEDNNIEKTENPSRLTLRNQKDYILLENIKISLKIHKISGKIISLIFKEKERELIRENDGIGIHVYKEKRNDYPAWEIYKNWTSYPVKKGIVRGIQIINDTPFIKTIKLIYKFKNTKIYHSISLRPNSDLVEFKTDIEVHDKKLLFKTRFPTNLNTNILHGEIAYGYIKRKIIPETDFEKGKWEFPAQKYVDISEEDLGITLINNSKYGFSTNEKGLYITLLHTPVRANTPFFSHLDLVPKEERTKYMDIGANSIEYALWIHNGDFIESAAWKKAHEYNFPLLYERFDEVRPTLPEFFDIEVNEKVKNVFQQEFSVVCVKNPTIILYVIKFPEKLILERENFNCNNNSIILVLRMFETSGFPQENVEVEFDPMFRINKAVETDLLERTIESTENGNGILIKDRRRLILHFKKFEIKTIKICVSI